jgi:toxin-antitoxin system PIN domain toxin
LSEQGYLPDINVLIALSDTKHSSHRVAAAWHKRIDAAKFYLCPVTESGFVRLSAAPQVGGRSIRDAILMLHEISMLPNVAHIPVAPTWLKLVAPLASRLHGYRQVTDALLLGLAIHNHTVLVTLDRSIAALAGKEHAANLLTLG